MKRNITLKPEPMPYPLNQFWFYSETMFNEEFNCKTDLNLIHLKQT